MVHTIVLRCSLDRERCRHRLLSLKGRALEQYRHGRIQGRTTQTITHLSLLLLRSLSSLLLLLRLLLHKLLHIHAAPQVEVTM